MHKSSTSGKFQMAPRRLRPADPAVQTLADIIIQAGYKVNVFLGDRQRRMAQQTLHLVDIHARSAHVLRHQNKRCKCVSEHMRTEPFLQAGSDANRADQVIQTGETQRFFCLNRTGSHPRLFDGYDAAAALYLFSWYFQFKTTLIRRFRYRG